MIRVLSALSATALLLAACSDPVQSPPAPPRDAPPPAAGAEASTVTEAPSAPVTRPAEPAQPSAELLEGAEALGRSLEAALRRGDADAFRAAFDHDAVIEAICDGAKIRDGQGADFRKGLRIGLDTSLGTLSGLWRDQSPKFKGVARVDGAVHLRFRFTSDAQGITILDLRVRTSDGRTKIDDFRNRTMGSGLVEQTRQASLPILASFDRGILERLVGGPGITERDLQAFGRLGTEAARGDHRAALATYASLPAALQDTVSATTAHITALSASGDNAAYAAALERAAEKFPPPNFRFALVDAYFLDGDFAKAIACVDEFMASVERDAAILTLRALVQLQAGDPAAAHTTIVEALTIEPETEYVRAKGLDVLLAAGDFPRIRETLVFLEGLGTYAFKGNLGDPAWAAFREAPESEPWR